MDAIEAAHLQYAAAAIRNLRQWRFQPAMNEGWCSVGRDLPFLWRIRAADA